MIRHTATKSRPSADIPWYDPELQDAWQLASQNQVDVGMINVDIQLSEDGLTYTIICDYENLESCILSQKDVVSNELRDSQRAYRENAGIRLVTETWEDTVTGEQYTESDMIAKEEEMRAAGKLTAHRYMRT